MMLLYIHLDLIHLLRNDVSGAVRVQQLVVEHERGQPVHEEGNDDEKGYILYPCPFFHLKKTIVIKPLNLLKKPKFQLSVLNLKKVLDEKHSKVRHL